MIRCGISGWNDGDHHQTGVTDLRPNELQTGVEHENDEGNADDVSGQNVNQPGSEIAADETGGNHEE